MREAIVGVDVGTSSLKAGVFTLNGEPLGAIAHEAYAVLSPEPDAREQDPDDWWRALASACRQLLAPLADDVHVRGVAIGGQAPTLCAVDADLRPTHPAITWLDQRPAAEAERLYTSIGLPVPAWGSWPAQIAWFARQRPKAFARTRWLLGCPEYLVSRLTGRPVSLIEWPPAEMAAIGIDLDRVPPCVTPSEVVGTVTAAAAQASGLAAGTPVVAGYIDGLMGVLGSGVRQRGDACMNSGTSGTFSAVSEPGAGYAILDLWVLGAATNTSGAALDWFADRIAHAGPTYDDLLREAAEVPAGSAGLLFLPHLAGERAPVLDARSRAAWVGLTLEHDRRHMLRSLLEGVAFSFRSVQTTLSNVRDVYCVGGQAHSDLWNQIKADVLNRPVLVPQVVEAAVVGAAILVGIGLREFVSREEAVAAMVRISRRFEPHAARAALYDELYAGYSRIYPALRETNWLLHHQWRNVSSSQVAARSTPSL